MRDTLTVNPKQNVGTALSGIRATSLAFRNAEAGSDYKKRDQTNFGGAFLRLGNVVNGTFVPLKGYVMPVLTAYNTSYHVEDQAVDWAIYQTNLVNGHGGNPRFSALRLDIYTFNSPCPLCHAYYRKNGYVGDIAQYTGILDVDVRIWTSGGNMSNGISPAWEGRTYQK